MAVVVHQEVVRLHIPVHDVGRMDEVDRTYGIITNNFELRLLATTIDGLHHYLPQVAGDALGDDEDAFDLLHPLSVVHHDFE